MTGRPVYEALADAFAAEGVRAHFTLLGTTNLHWATALAALPAVQTYYARHEHCACAMAMGYAEATDEPGVASVTCGPGLTQIMTALVTAAHARLPLVVFAGESPLRASFYNQRIDQAPLVTASGGHYIAAHSVERMFDYVRDAFLIARTERRPVVIGVPSDLQKQEFGASDRYVPSTAVMPDVGAMMSNPVDVEPAAQLVAGAKRVIVLGGRGAKRAGAGAACEQLAEICGGLLANTLPVRGLFDSNPFSLGVAGGYAHRVARARFAECDLVIAVGASLTSFTADGGKLFPNAKIIQIDTDPVGVRHGRKVADLYVRADAKAGVEALVEALVARGRRGPDWRASAEVRPSADDEKAARDFETEPGTVHPALAVRALDDAIPKDWDIVTSAGHNSFFSAQLRGRRVENAHAIREFGAIGNGLAYAIGVAAAKPDKPVVLIEGDGGFLMHIQELDTVRRHRLKILMCILNDGAYGSEIHHMRAEGLDPSGATFGRGDLGAVARGFGLRGSVVTKLDQIGPALEGFRASDTAEVLDVHISDRVRSSFSHAHLPAHK